MVEGHDSIDVEYTGPPRVLRMSATNLHRVLHGVPGREAAVWLPALGRARTVGVLIVGAWGTTLDRWSAFLAVAEEKVGRGM